MCIESAKLCFLAKEGQLRRLQPGYNIHNAEAAKRELNNAIR